jgi:hypothetical protein
MPKSARIITFAIAAIAGVFLLISGFHGPVETYDVTLGLLSRLIQNQQILQIASIVATVLIGISLAGGLAVIGGGSLILLGRVGTGKFVIDLGLGVGLLWLVIIAVTFVSAHQVAAAFAEYSTVGWTGIILAIVARIMAK